MQTTLHFGLDFDSPVIRSRQALPGAEAVVQAPPAFEIWLGPRGLLRWLETRLGLGGYPENTDYLRIELYRQALQQYLDERPEADIFFRKSFAADRFATAAVLLSHRDTLLLAGWDFEIPKPSPLNPNPTPLTSHLSPLTSKPPRLRTLAEVEQVFQNKFQHDPALAVQATGEADRWAAVLAALPNCDLGATQIFLYESKTLQPIHIQRFIQKINTPGVVQEVPLPAGNTLPDVRILRARRDSDAATFLAQLLRSNPDWSPTFLVPELSRTLEQAFLLEGLPAQGILSASLARPALQVLKLAPAFLWEPVDVFKIMEFVTLPVKPLDRGLALEIARVLAERPGLFSDNWYGAVLGYLNREGLGPEVRQQYDFWFGERRYPADQAAPKAAAVRLYSYLQQWAREHFEQTNGKDPALLVLAEQARRIRELLEALPEQRITFLELERIVRTVYEPSPAQFAEAEVGHYAFAHRPGALAAPVDDLVWWNFLYQNTAPPPDFWQPAERQWLTQQGCAPALPRTQSERLLAAQQRPLSHTRHRLWLVVPEQADGSETPPHLLLGDLEVRLKEQSRALKDITYHLDSEADRQRLRDLLHVPDAVQLTCRPAQPTRPVVPIDWQEKPPATPDQAANGETPTQLESLLYYPHRWYFRQRLGLYPANLLSVTRDTQLLGNLAHRFFELLLPTPGLLDLDRPALNAWVDQSAAQLLEKEGATLLLYGREPEREAFLQKVKNAAWKLIGLLRSNGWSVAATELNLTGTFADTSLRGKADLVLQRGAEQAIVDLKWGGFTKRKELIKNEEDLQLVLYAHLLPPVGEWPHTAYFILDSGRMLARNQEAFREAEVPGRPTSHVEACQRVFAKMEATYAWRMRQLRAGQLEIRNSRTATALSDLYADELLDLLEMKNEDARWDDYRTLVDFG